MATYVNNLRLKEIATGAESGTWGTSTNTNLELIADAFGSGTEDISGTTHTTTVPDGSADEGRAIYLKYTGALAANNTITLAPNTINKLWIIENATTDSGSSGPYSIIINQGTTVGSGGKITIGNGKVAAIYTDGAGTDNAAVLDAFADLVVTDSFQVAGPTLTIGDAAAEDTKLLFDGNAQDFYIGLDDSADDLVIGLGSTVGTTPAVTIDENQAVVFPAASVTVGDGTAEDTKLVYNGNAQDFYVGLDDSVDDLLIGVGSTVGTTPAIKIDENAITTLVNGATFGGAVIADTVQGTTGTGALYVRGDSGAGSGIQIDDNGTMSLGSTAQGHRRVGTRGAFISGGASNEASDWYVAGTLTGASGDTQSLAGLLIAEEIRTQSASENVDVVASLLVREPQLNATGVTDNGYAVLVASTVYIQSAPTEGALNASLYVAAGPIVTAVTTFSSSDATPSVKGGNLFKTSGTTAITDFDDGVVGQTISILAGGSITITYNTSHIILNGDANFAMADGDTLTLTMFNDTVWQEVSRMDRS